MERELYGNSTLNRNARDVTGKPFFATSGGKEEQQVVPEEKDHRPQLDFSSPSRRFDHYFFYFSSKL